MELALNTLLLLMIKLMIKSDNIAQSDQIQGCDTFLVPSELMVFIFKKSNLQQHSSELILLVTKFIRIYKLSKEITKYFTQMLYSILMAIIN
jgi:hypothetical protein